MLVIIIIIIAISVTLFIKIIISEAFATHNAAATYRSNDKVSDEFDNKLSTF